MWPICSLLLISACSAEVVTMSKPKVLVTSSEIFPAGLELLRTCCDVKVLQGRPSRQELLRTVPGHDAVVVVGHYAIDSEFLDAAGRQLKVVSTVSAGYDHLDIAELKRRGIKIGHTPEVLSAAVAEMAVMLLLNAARRAHEGRLLLESGQPIPKLLGLDVRGSTVGIVGLGSIGQEVVKRLIPFGVERFIYTGHSRKSAGDALGAEFVNWDTLLAESDFVVVATPLTNETRGLFDDEAFSKMKNTAVLVNVGRGAVVRTDSLLRALQKKTIFAAGVDVTDPEPLPKDHELLALPNFEIVPHLGSATEKTRSDMSSVAAQNVINGLVGKALLYPL